jgi:hyperosmotically inducible protein
MNTRARLLLSTAASVLAAAGLVGCNQAQPPAVPTPAVSTAAANVVDIDVTEHVKTALLQSDALKGMDISVETLNGDVRLNGVLDTQSQIDEAIRIARAAEGAHSIHDELTVKK